MDEITPKEAGDCLDATSWRYAALGYFRATLTSKASEKAREVMSRALGFK